MSKGFRRAMLWLFVAIQIALVIIITNLVIDLGDKVDHGFYFHVVFPFFLIVIAFQIIPLVCTFTNPKS